MNVDWKGREKMFLPFILYFPEDKSEYFTSFLQMIPFLILAILTLWFIIRISKKEEKKADEVWKKMSEKENED